MWKKGAIVAALALAGCSGGGFDVASDPNDAGESDATGDVFAPVDGASTDTAAPIGDAGADTRDASCSDALVDVGGGSAFNAACMLGVCCKPDPSVEPWRKNGGCFVFRDYAADGGGAGWTGCYYMEVAATRGYPCPADCSK
jgi:hypothetical protein